MPFGVRSSDGNAYVFNDLHHLLAQPIDIDGDGNLDLMESSDIRIQSGKIHNGYTFRTLVNNTWVAKPGWDLPFTAASSEDDNCGGKRRFAYFQWADLNSDGYQDLVLETGHYGELHNPLTEPLTSASKFVDMNTAVAYINNGKNGPGWTRSNTRYLPETILDVNQDLGRRLVDLNGDGVLEISEAKGVSVNSVRRTYFMNGSSDYRWNSTPGMHNPAPSRYDIPDTSAFVDTSLMNRGAFLADINGDGLVDLVESNPNTTSQVWMNRAEIGSTAWKLEVLPQPFTTASTSNYNIPFPLHAEKDGTKVPFGYEMADLNGDGLVDILFSNTGDSGESGTANTTLLNTGNGWQQLENWALPGSRRIYESTSDRNNGKRRAKLQDINGDGFPDLITGLIDETPKVWFNRCKPEVLVGIVDGMNTELIVNYQRLNDPTPTTNGFKSRVYQKNQEALLAGQVAVIDSRLVVSSYSEPDGIGGRRLRHQRYGDLRFDRFNESSLGFGWIEAMDGLNDQITRTETSRVYPFGGSPVYTQTTVDVKSGDLTPALPGVSTGLKVLSQETAAYSELPPVPGVGGVIRRPVQSSSVKILRDLTNAVAGVGNIVSQTTTVQFFDDYGFVTASLVSTLGGANVATNNFYNHTTGGNWYLGRLESSEVTKSGSGKPSITKHSAFTYDIDGLLKTEKIEPGTAFVSTKTYERDGFGNITKTTVTAAGVTGERFTSASYAGDGDERGQSLDFNILDF